MEDRTQTLAAIALLSGTTSVLAASPLQNAGGPWPIVLQIDSGHLLVTPTGRHSFTHFTRTLSLPSLEA